MAWFVADGGSSIIGMARGAIWEGRRGDSEGLRGAIVEGIGGCCDVGGCGICGMEESLSDLRVGRSIRKWREVCGRR